MRTVESSNIARMFEHCEHVMLVRVTAENYPLLVRMVEQQECGVLHSTLHMDKLTQAAPCSYIMGFEQASDLAMMVRLTFDCERVASASAGVLQGFTVDINICHREWR